MAFECNNLGPCINCLNFQDSSDEMDETLTHQVLDNLFGPLYEEYYAPRTPEVSDNFAANTLDNKVTPSSSSIIVEYNDAPQIVLTCQICRCACSKFVIRGYQDGRYKVGFHANDWVQEVQYEVWDPEAMIGSVSGSRSCKTCGGPHQIFKCQAVDGFTQGHVYAATGDYNMGENQMTKNEKAFNERPQGALPCNTIPNPVEKVKVITTHSGMTLAGPSVPPLPPSSSSKEVEQNSKPTMDQLPIPYNLRFNKDKLQEKSDIQIHKFLQMSKKLHFNISLVEALAHMREYAKMLIDLLNNKEKLIELANTPLNENCLAVLLKKLPEKLGDRRKFLIPYDFNELEECIALADLVAYPASIVEDVFMQVGKFTFLVDFVVVDYDVDHHVPFILRRTFLRTAYALVDVYGEELIIRVGGEKLTFNVDSTSKYSHKHRNESINLIDIIDTTCEDHFPEVLTVQKSIHPFSGSPIPSFDSIVTSPSPSLTLPLENSYFLLEETDAFHSLDLIPCGINNEIFDAKGDILLLEILLNIDFTRDLLTQELNNEIFDAERDILLLKKLLNIDSTNDPPLLELNNDPEGDINFHENLLKDEILETERSEIYQIIGEPSDTFLTGDEEIKFNPFKDIDDPVSIPKIPSDESKVHIEMSVLWGNSLPIPDGSLPLSSKRILLADMADDVAATSAMTWQEGPTLAMWQWLSNEVCDPRLSRWQKHLEEFKRIYRYLRQSINMGLWYSKDSEFELIAYSDADLAGYFNREAEYVSLSACCAQVIWMRTQQLDYGYRYNKMPIYCDSKSAISISCNPIQHSRTKHINIRYHFIKDHVEKGTTELYFVKMEYQLTDLFTKALPRERFEYPVHWIEFYKELEAEFLGASEKLVRLQIFQLELRLGKTPRSFRPVKSAEIYGFAIGKRHLPIESIIASRSTDVMMEAQ
nr:reverse transcriptase domain-containing protein [Tanacetum cinerariifolium]